MTSSKPEIQTVPIELSVAYVAFSGNTGFNKNTNEYEYFHAFNIKNILTPNPAIDTKMVITLSKNQEKRFEIYSYAFSNKAVLDTTFSAPGKEIAITCRKGFENMISHFIIMVRDKDKHMCFCCDPQVINSPPVPPPLDS